MFELYIQGVVDYSFYNSQEKCKFVPLIKNTMNQKIWDLYAPIYALAMKQDERAYKEMYNRISAEIAGKDVLELATGPGLLAKSVAKYAGSFIATDYSRGMIDQALKGDCPPNLSFQVADATNLEFENNQFDVVIIANALHVMPEPKKALDEIARVLRPGGLLIAPNFINHHVGLISRVWAGILRIAGISFEHQWTEIAYEEFLSSCGWNVEFATTLKVRIPLRYVECRIVNMSNA